MVFFLELVSKLDPQTLNSILLRLEKYANRIWVSTLSEKNRKLELDIQSQNFTKFSDIFLSLLYCNPFKHKYDIMSKQNLHSPYNYNKVLNKSEIVKKQHKPRRFIKHRIYKEKLKNRDDEILNTKEVVNLSKHSLSKDETFVLSKNLQFCPTPDGYNPVSLSLDLFQFERRLRLKEFHLDNAKQNEFDPTDIMNHPKLKQANTFTPPQGRDNYLDTFIDSVNSEIMTKTKKPSQSNLTENQKIALKNLSNNKFITIKPADKGGAVVIQNTDDYITECNRQLQDKTFYKQINKDPTTKHNNIIKSTLSTAVKQHDIDLEISNLLTEKNPTTARFYTVPKIHKENNPGRPIISGNGCPTEKISVYVNNFLQPLATNLDSYVHDDMDFLKHIDNINKTNIIKSDTLLVTLDVSSLYTNIPHQDGTEACRHFLDTRKDQTPSTSFLCNLITLILTLNNFVFNGLNYLQIQGTAMGTCMAPNYANLFMGLLESKFIKTCTHKPLKWLRYIDDIFILWNEGRDKLMQFISAANDFHPTIKFTHEISTTSINFLDITVHKTPENKLETDLYSKPTNANLFLHYTSCHPQHTKNSLPYSLAYRLLRICSNENFLSKRLSDLKLFLLNRNFKSKTIDSAFRRIRNLSRNDTFHRKNKNSKTDRVPLVTTFHPGLPNLPHILQKYLPILHSSTRCKKAIPNCPIVSFHRPKNLRDILVRSKVATNHQNGFFKCNNKRCFTCRSALTGSSIHIHSTGKTFSIKKHLNCQSYNVIYIITCSKCNKQYVGKTETQLNIRVNNHRSFINTNKPDPLAKHFNTDNHSFEHFQITAIDFVPHATTHELCNKETFFIKLFKTAKPHGLNSHSQNIYPIANY